MRSKTQNIITYTDIKDGVVGVDLVVEAATKYRFKTFYFQTIKRGLFS
jgi:predicted dinucleotide-utilizing enzyme